MKEQFTYIKEDAGKNWARTLLAVLLIGALLLGLAPGALAEEGADLNALICRAPELHTHWAAKEQTPWTVKQGMPVTVRLSFRETEDKAFARDGQTMVYRVPDLLTPVSDGEEHAFYVWADGVLARGLYRVDVGEKTVSVRWDETSPNYDRLIAAENREFSLDLTFAYQGGGESVDFGAGFLMPVVLGTYQKMAFGSALPENDGYLESGEFNGQSVTDYIPCETHVSIFGVVPQGSTVRDRIAVPGAAIAPDSFWAERISVDEKGQVTREQLTLEACHITVESVTDTEFALSLPAMVDKQEIVIHYYAKVDPAALEAPAEQQEALPYAALDFLLKARWDESSTLLHDSLHNAAVFASFEAENGEDEPAFVIRKVDLEGKPLSGAAYRLEQRLPDGMTRLVALDESRTTDTVFTYAALTPGDYLLTETTAPAGYVVSAPQEFTVTPECEVLWWGTPEAFRYAMYTLTGVKPEGQVIWITHKDVNMEEEPEEVVLPTLTVLTDDWNASDLSQDAREWAVSADYAMGDQAPFRLEARLASNVSFFRQYHITFTDTLEQGLTNLKDYAVTIVRGGVETPVDASLWQVLSEDDHSFRLKVEWGDGSATLPHDLNGALVRVYFSAALNENAAVGPMGNVNAAGLEYSADSHLTVDENGALKQSAATGLTGDYRAIVFTYQLKLNKVDEDGNALPGAAYRLERKVAPRTSEEEETLTEMLFNEADSTETEFVFTGLDDGEYILTEIQVPAGHIKAAPVLFTVRAAHDEAWNGLEETRAQVLADLAVEKQFGEIDLSTRLEEGLILGENALNVRVPEFELATLDVNDSQEAEEEPQWGLSADYDMGDSVPFRMRIKLPANVSSYAAYHVTVEDFLPEGMLNNKDYKVLVAGEEFTDYTADDEDEELENRFALTLNWGDGETLLPDTLNKAEVTITFTALLHERAALGAEGNVNRAVLRYSDSPVADTESATEEAKAVIFTYGLTINKIDEKGQPLPGAAFKLEKKLSGGELKEVFPEEHISTETKFIFLGLDDGVYVLTETQTPEGCLEPVPAEFILTADHAQAWPEDQGSLLLKLEAEKVQGDFDPKADTETGMVAADFMNVKEREIEFKVDDVNDSDPVENASDWQDTADYDIGDAVPFRVKAVLPGNMGSFKQFHFTFADAMEPGFTLIRDDFQVTLDGQPMTDYTVNETDAGFELTLSWDGGEEYLPGELGGKEVEILFTARLNEKAVLGEKGNVNAMRLRYSDNPLKDTEQETEEKRVLVFTYGLTVNKTDENGNALPGAAFILEKKLADGTRKQIALNEKQSGASAFVFTGLDDGSYILTESKAPAGYVPAAPTEFILSANHASAWDGKDETRAQALTGIQTAYTVGYVALTADKAAGMLSGSAVNTPEPTLEHKADDKNDSNTQEDARLWVDSVDYDIGDSVPFRVHAALTGNVSWFKEYRATFVNELDEGLTNNKDYQVFVNGKQVTDYTVTDTDKGFELTLRLGNGLDLLPEEYNGAEVNIYFTATVNSSARTDSTGNASTVYLRYSIDPFRPTEGQTKTERALVFTYQVVVNSLNEQGERLAGAAYRLEKVLADGTRVAVNLDSDASDGEKSVFMGVDDGDYVLTQTQAPDGYVATSAMTFTIRADHTAVWNGDTFTRAYVLTSLAGARATGALHLSVNKAGGQVIADVENSLKPMFEKKVDDLNDSSNIEDAVEWADTADYDIGDSVRFLLRATLPANVSAYESYHITFVDTMEKGLTNNRDYRVTVGGREFTAFTVAEETENGFEITLNWAKADIAKALDGAEVQVLYTARLNENARVGAEGNVNSAFMRYPDRIDADTESETDTERAIVYTYRFTVNKADEGGKPLAGAAFKLEKILANGSKKQVPLDTDTSTDTAFSFRGLDDGRYILTETKAPNGYVISAPVEFTITARHDAQWNNNLYTRTALLTDLAAATDSTSLTIRVDKETWNLRTTMINQKSSDKPADDNPSGYRNRFHFTKVWLGDVEDSIDFTLYNPNGTVRRKSFKKTKVSDTEFLYEAWFTDWSEFYVQEEPVEGYKVRYENVGSHAGETDKCYNGGKIINYKVPKTGDESNLGLWLALTAVGLAGIGSLVFMGRRRRNGEK